MLCTNPSISLLPLGIGAVVPWPRRGQLNDLIPASHYLFKNMLLRRWSVSGAGRIVLKKRSVRMNNLHAQRLPP
ncbi:hypothetical protein [Paenibacillus sp. NPDC055715]